MDKATTTGVVMVLVFGLGLMIGYYAGSNNITASDAMTQVEEATTGRSENTQTTNSASNNTGGNEVDTQAQASGATTVNTSQLTPGQRQLLETLGVDTENLTITPEMVACAEAKVGAARVAEIQNGATPTFMEGASLMACYSN